MPDTTRNDSDLEGLLRRAIEMADEVRPGWQMQQLLKEALASGGYEDHGLIERDPYTQPIPGPAEFPRYTSAPGHHRNLKPEAAKREAEAVLESVNKARDAVKELLADPIVVTAADLEDDDPEPETPTTDPNGPNHGEDPDAARMGKNDNGSGITRDDPSGAGVGTRTDTHTDSMTVNSDSTTVNTGETPGPEGAKK